MSDITANWNCVRILRLTVIQDIINGIAQVVNLSLRLLLTQGIVFVVDATRVLDLACRVEQYRLWGDSRTTGISGFGSRIKEQLESAQREFFGMALRCLGG